MQAVLSRRDQKYHLNCSGAVKKLLLILCISLGIGAMDAGYAQAGGKKREGRKRRGDFVLFQYKSRGHADEFARGSVGRRTIWSKLFRRDRSGWRYRKSGSARSNYKENRFLFFRFKSPGREENAITTDRQNKERTRKREHGNRVFKFKKYKRSR
jgi:hypothetical protein